MSPTVLDAIIADVTSLRHTMEDADIHLGFALEADKDARRKSKEADKAYADAEAEFLAEIMLSVDGKNAEARKTQVDAAMVKARRDGVLSKPWAVMNAAMYDKEDKAMALEQAVRHFRAVEVALSAAGDLARSLAPR